MNIPQDDSSLCQEDRDNCNNPAYSSFLGDKRTARPGFRKETPTSVHKAGKFWIDNEKNAQTYKNRVLAARAREYLIHFLDFLEGVIRRSGRYDAPLIDRFLADHPSQQHAQNRNGHTTAIHRRSMREIRLNLERMGYKESMDVIKDICHWIGAMKFQYGVREEFGYMARMMDKAMHQAEASAALKSKYKICCFLDRFGPAPMIRCDGMCDYLLEGGNVIYQIVALDIDYNLCYKCYRRAPEIISFDLPIRHNSTKTRPATVRKSCLVRKTIPVIPQPEREETIECFTCFARHHKMCVHYDEFNWEAGYAASSPKFKDNFTPSYMCDSCVHQLGSKSLNHQVFTAKTMQITTLSKFMQSQLQHFLYRLCKECRVPLPPQIQVRELSSRKIFFNATGRMAEEYLRHGKPIEFSYTARSIMLTQVSTIDGRLPSEKALFNVIVHEYDNGWVLISYLDSVRLFQPALFRRKLYQRVLVVYMEYLQKFRPNEFQRIYVWVCPPKPGEEYVFLGRPADQIVLDATGLRIWYEKIFTQAKEEDLIENFLIIDSTNNPFRTYLDIPYFADDFWAEKLELVHTEVDTETAAYQDFLEDDRNPNGDLRSKRRKKRANPIPEPKPIQERVDEIFEKDLKDAVFIVNLKQKQNHSSLVARSSKQPVEKDVDIWNQFMFKRGNYQLSCRQRQFDFSDERRATYATLHMHSRMAEESLEVACCYCEVIISEGMYCYKCESAVFCNNCINTHGNFEEEHGTRFMRPFKVPFVKPSKPVDLTFGKILNFVQQEAKFLTKFAYEVTFPIQLRDPDPDVRNVVSVLQHHMQMIGQDDSHKGSICRMCGYVWLTMGHHRRICCGNICNVPSCGRDKPLFDNNGSRFERNDRWNRQFLDCGTQVAEEEIEEEQQQPLSPPHQLQALNEEEGQATETEEQQEVAQEHDIEDTTQSPVQQNCPISHCNFVLVEREMLQPQPSSPEAAPATFLIVQNNLTEHDDESPALGE